MTPAPTGGQLPNMSLRNLTMAAWESVLAPLHYSERVRYKNNGCETGAFHLFLPHVEAKA